MLERIKEYFDDRELADVLRRVLRIKPEELFAKMDKNEVGGAHLIDTYSAVALTALLEVSNWKKIRKEDNRLIHLSKKTDSVLNRLENIAVQVFDDPELVIISESAELPSLYSKKYNTFEVLNALFDTYDLHEETHPGSGNLVRLDKCLHALEKSGFAGHTYGHYMLKLALLKRNRHEDYEHDFKKAQTTLRKVTDFNSIPKALADCWKFDIELMTRLSVKDKGASKANAELENAIKQAEDAHYRGGLRGALITLQSLARFAELEHELGFESQAMEALHRVRDSYTDGRRESLDRYLEELKNKLSSKVN
jgi:hypothetical protein